jgi:hypothetical protein
MVGVAVHMIYSMGGFKGVTLDGAKRQPRDFQIFTVPACCVGGGGGLCCGNLLEPTW